MLNVSWLSHVSNLGLRTWPDRTDYINTVQSIHRACVLCAALDCHSLCIEQQQEPPQRVFQSEIDLLGTWCALCAKHIHMQKEIHYLQDRHDLLDILITIISSDLTVWWNSMNCLIVSCEKVASYFYNYHSLSKEKESPVQDISSK